MKILTMMGCGIAMLLISCEANNNQAHDKTSSAKDIKYSTVEAKDNNTEKYNPETVTDTITTAAIPMQAGAPAVTDWNKKIIKTASLQLQLKDFKTFNTYIHQAIQTHGGYIATEQQQQTEEQITDSISLKVPAHKFEQLLNDISDKDVIITQKQITSEDVTAEFVDTKGRIEARRLLRAKYNDFMKDAKTMTEALQVQNEINAITETLEAGNNRINTIHNEASYNTVNLSYTQLLNGTATVAEPQSFIAKFGNAFKTGAGFIQGLLLAIATIWPVILIVITALMLVKKYNKRKMLTK